MTDTASQTPSLYKLLTITAIKEEVPGFKTFVFGAHDAKAITYKAGQYLTFVHQAQGTEEIRRSYSITSAPELQEPLTVGIKRVANGVFSRLLIDQAQVGDQLLTIGATGLFTLPDDLYKYKQVFLLAAGSGITPVLSLLKAILYTSPTLSVVLVYSNSSPQKTAFHDELKDLAAKFPEQLRIEFLFSNSPDLARARLYKDLLQDLLRQYATTPYQQMLFYLCGPMLFMRMCYYALRQVDVPTNNIRKESFNTTKVEPTVLPPDTAPHSVLLRLPGREHSLQVQYPHTILQAARKQDIQLPYSCETGKCGSCVTRCIQGQVWMSYNEVLTEKDLRKGLTLTCVGYPVGGDVILEIL